MEFVTINLVGELNIFCIIFLENKVSILIFRLENIIPDVQ